MTRVWLEGGRYDSAVILIRYYLEANEIIRIFVTEYLKQTKQLQL